MPEQRTILKSVVPIEFVKDVTASAAYFRDKLGFAVDFLFGEPPYYGSVSRDTVWMHLRRVGEPNFAALRRKRSL